MRKQFLILAALTILQCAGAQESVNLSSLETSKILQSYGSPGVNKAVTGEGLSMAGVKYESGVGVIANSTAKINLHKKATEFRAQIGVNDNSISYNASDVISIPLTDGEMLFYRTDGDEKQFVGLGAGDKRVAKGSVVFKLVADGKEIYNSGLVRGGDRAKDVAVDVAGVQMLELVVTDAGDGSSGDHANWADASILYSDNAPTLVDANTAVEAKPLDAEVSGLLNTKISKLPRVELPIAQPKFDWLLDNSEVIANVYQTHNGKDIVLSNGLVSRVFRVMPNLATIDFINHITGESMLRAVSNEGVLTIDGKTYPLGGLDGQFEYGYTKYDWVDKLVANSKAFRIADFEVNELKPHIAWKNSRWSLARKWDATGKVLTFHLAGTDELNNVKVKLHYTLYDKIPTISKWIEVENNTGVPINIDSFVLEQLAMAEPESPVELKEADKFRKPNIHIESDWAFHGFIEKEADVTEYWEKDVRYTSQCNYPRVTPCLLEIKLPMGPNATVKSGDTFSTFRTWLTPFDGEDREKNGLYVRRFYRTIAPWLTENPIFMHCTSSDEKVVKEAIDQCAATGYEMVILSFGSGLNMENESEENYAKFKMLNDYARSKGIELGGYSLLSSRWISDEVDVINPKTGKRGGMIFGSSPCLSSDWGYDYFRKVKKFYEKTGMSVFENDGSYPGNVCASTCHAHHKGLEDSQWEQRKQIENLYKWMCESGIYTNVPDIGYILNGSTKVGIGYREVNWSLPRERQLVLGRQVMYDGLWDRMSSMCWTFVPLTQYHGGGAAATLEPLSEHLKDYKAHMIQNYGYGVQACYRGHRLYDTPTTKETVKEVIDWYKNHRDILNSDIIHLRRADGRDWDGVIHANPSLETKGMALFFNPLNTEITRTISVPLYYTGLDKTASISFEDGKAKKYKLNRDYTVDITITIPANGYRWFTVE